MIMKILEYIRLSGKITQVKDCSVILNKWYLQHRGNQHGVECQTLTVDLRGLGRYLLT